MLTISVYSCAQHPEKLLTQWTDRRPPHMQIREGRVKSISAKAAGELKQDGWVFLDVRPPPEIEKVCMLSLVSPYLRSLLIVFCIT